MLDSSAEHPKAYVIDVASAPMLDSSAAKTIGSFAHKAERHGAAVYISGAPPAVQATLERHGADPSAVRFFPTLAEAVTQARAGIRADDKVPETSRAGSSRREGVRQGLA